MAFGFVVMTGLLQMLPPQFTKILVDNVLKRQPEKLPYLFETVATMLGYNTMEGFDPKLGVYMDMPAEIRYQWLCLIVGAVVVTTAAAAFIGIIRETLSVWISNRLGFELRQEVFRKLEQMSVQYHDNHPVGQLMTRCTQDIEALQGFVVQLTSGFGYQLIVVLFVAGMMFTLNWKLALIAIISRAHRDGVDPGLLPAHRAPLPQILRPRGRPCRTCCTAP